MKTIPLTEILKSAHQALLRNWGRAVLTSLSMVIGTASLVLVVVAGISGRDYTLEQIQGVGTNLIALSNESPDSATGTRSLSDRLTPEDLKAIQTQVPGVRNAAGLMTSRPTVTLQGITRGISLVGVLPDDLLMFK